MGVAERISAADVMLDVAARNKQSLLEILAAEAASRFGRPAHEVLEALEAREALGTTALGKGVALPHAQLIGADRPMVLFARLRRPIDFDARDAEPVDLVFLVLWPSEDPKGLLNALSEICRTPRDPLALRRLRLAASPQDVAGILRLQHGPGPSPSAGPWSET